MTCIHQYYLGTTSIRFHSDCNPDTQFCDIFSVFLILNPTRDIVNYYKKILAKLHKKVEGFSYYDQEHLILSICYKFYKENSQMYKFLPKQHKYFKV